MSTTSMKTTGAVVDGGSSWSYSAHASTATSLQNGASTGGSHAKFDSAFGSVGGSTSLATSLLQCSAFGFTTTDVPTGSTLTGVTVTIEREASTASGASAIDLHVYLMKGGSAVATVDKASSSNWGASWATATYTFSGSDLATLGISASDVVASGFGVALAATLNFPTGAVWAQVDLVQIQISYVAPVRRRAGGSMLF